ncbi:hypothetical protein [Martelella alba]|uniref:Nucleoside-diphosphate-sugar epimerase n=1 Tax=Martelella alba TaxID=2590451 RepID=A0ABY2SLR8_9HYPH|nr:hypothetical protein [Martelella alba]TKI06719.1 hypothetical protein FCN80_08975 [Martelella alba]
MNYLITGCHSLLGARVAEIMLTQVNPQNLILAYPSSYPFTNENIVRWTKAGLNVRLADYHDFEQLFHCFGKTDRLFISSEIFDNWHLDSQYKIIIDAAIYAGIEYILYASPLHYNFHKLNYQPVHHSYLEIEIYIRDVCHKAGVVFNIMSNNLGTLGSNDMFPSPSGWGYHFVLPTGKSISHLREECALAIVSLLLGDGVKNTHYSLIKKETFCEYHVSNLSEGVLPSKSLYRTEEESRSINSTGHEHPLCDFREKTFPYIVKTRSADNDLFYASCGGTEGYTPLSDDMPPLLE